MSSHSLPKEDEPLLLSQNKGLEPSKDSYNGCRQDANIEQAVTSSPDIPDHVDPDDHVERLGNTSLTILTICLCTGAFLSAMDTSIVNTIFNVIGTEFHSANLTVWIVVSYMLCTSSVQPLYGKLSDIFGRKTILTMIMCFFMIGSWLCGASQNIVQMALARALAGMGGGGLMIMSSVVIHDLVPIRQRGQYQSYVNMAQTTGATIGAPLGGIINDFLGWRYCFYLNVPPCLFLLYIYAYRLNNYNIPKHSKPLDGLRDKLKRIDFGGSALWLTVNLSFVAATAMGGNTREWNDPLVVGLLCVSGSAFVAFGAYELVCAKFPLISPRLIKNRNVAAVCLNNFFLNCSTMALTYLMPQFFMGVLGYNPSAAGLWVLPRTGLTALGCWAAGRYLRAVGRYRTFIRSTMVFHVLAVFAISQWTYDTPMWLRIIPMNLEGYCFGTVLVATMVALVADIDSKDSASATSMIYLCRSTGWLMGSTVASTILQANLKTYLLNTITGEDAEKIISFVRTSISEIQSLAPDIYQLVVAGLYSSIHKALRFALLCSVCCFTTTLFLKNCQLKAKK
ncbi:major facilitator superfamily domain-containing protein [Radiomyces spectabilis]|uniref:major facilitator superfamily domain-containing protein n=1 Tax=Radiomyces spectabilis TaxID=64574 RepID=UPI00221FB185|nr:major facilitator superfamily domain-containing protein [Radiomyces spectabilis]KAI8377966.1 major facilitator superfamily domain-containing protein [Radiomyces spectabilis]